MAELLFRGARVIDPSTGTDAVHRRRDPRRPDRTPSAPTWPPTGLETIDV